MNWPNHLQGPDTSTLAVDDFDIDTRTGFLPPQVPLTRLPPLWKQWEAVLDDAGRRRIQLGDKARISAAEQESSATWRASIAFVRLASFVDLTIY